MQTTKGLTKRVFPAHKKYHLFNFYPTQNLIVPRSFLLEKGKSPGDKVVLILATDHELVNLYTVAKTIQTTSTLRVSELLGYNRNVSPLPWGIFVNQCLHPDAFYAYPSFSVYKNERGFWMFHGYSVSHPSTLFSCGVSAYLSLVSAFRCSLFSFFTLLSSRRVYNLARYSEEINVVNNSRFIYPQHIPWSWTNSFRKPRIVIKVANLFTTPITFIRSHFAKRNN